MAKKRTGILTGGGDVPGLNGCTPSTGQSRSTMWSSLGDSILAESLKPFCVFRDKRTVGS
jgi:hypothetical protein